ncbi:MAG: rhodanese-like domain-containing protein [Gemmobacter sp.]
MQSGKPGRRGLLVLGAGAGIAALAGSFVLPRGYGGETLDPPAAHRAALARTITLVDIRRPDEWAQTGIGEGAHPLDMRRQDFDEALARLVGNDRAAPVALICARGVRSARLASRLTRAGHARIIDIPEGMLGSGNGPGWIARGLPVRPG